MPKIENKASRLIESLYLETPKPKSKQAKSKKPPPDHVAAYLQKRVQSQELTLQAAPINPFNVKFAPNSQIKKNLRQMHIATLHKFIEPLRTDLSRFKGGTPAVINKAIADCVDTYMDFAHENNAIARMEFLDFACAYLYVRADIPIWLAFLPQIRQGKVLAHWQRYYQGFNQAMWDLKWMAPTRYRRLFRGMTNTDAFEDVQPGEIFTFDSPASCTQIRGFAEKFMHPDVIAVSINNNNFSCYWGDKPPPTIGDVFMQVWDVQDSTNIMAIWEEKAVGASDDSIEEIQDQEHLILEGTECEVLLNESALHPRSKRPVQFVVLQDVRSKGLGQEPRLLDALDLAKK